MHFNQSLALITLLVLSSLSSVRAQHEASTNWLIDGKNMEAEFVRLTDDGVVLRRLSDRREGEIPLSRLDLDGRLAAIKLGHPDAFSKLRAKAMIPATPDTTTPSTPTQPINVDSMLQSPFSGQETIEEFLATTKRELTKGNYFISWHTVPPEIQNQVEDFIVQSVGKAGPSTIVQFRVLLKDIHTVVTRKEEYILNHPSIANNPFLASSMSTHWPLVKQYVAALSDETLWQKENFQKGNVVRWLAEISQALGAQHSAMVAAIDQATGGMASKVMDFKFKIERVSSTSAVVEVRGRSEKLTYNKVGGIWVPSAMSQVQLNLEMASKQLESTPDPSSAVRAALIGAISVVGELKRAESQEDFNEAIAKVERLLRSVAPSGLNGPTQAGTAAPAKLGEKVEIHGHSIRPPFGYNRIEQDGPMGTKFTGWVGQQRPNGTAPSITLSVVPLPAGEETPPLHFASMKMIEGVKKRNTDWSESELAFSHVGGVEYAIRRWTGNNAASGIPMQGIMYVTVADGQIVVLATQDVRSHRESLKIGEQSLLSFRLARD